MCVRACLCVCVMGGGVVVQTAPWLLPSLCCSLVVSVRGNAAGGLLLLKVLEAGTLTPRLLVYAARLRSDNLHLRLSD